MSAGSQSIPPGWGPQADGDEADSDSPQPYRPVAPDVDSEDSDQSEDFGIDMRDIMAALERTKAAPEASSRPKLLSSFDLEGIAELILSGKARRIVCMCGAGISVSAGIPDFRTPGTGLYSQLERYNLPKPEAVFEIDYFRHNPKPFHLLAKELFPGHYCPTPTHVFMRLLHEKGLLLRVFTQNIDSLEHLAGLPKDMVVAAHGNFDSARCIACGEAHDIEYVRGAIMGGNICRCKICDGLVKPDIVFFGENLPERFYEHYQQDFPSSDLLLVIGTSLVVNPFASLIDAVEEDCPRLLINRERVGEKRGGTASLIAALLGLGDGEGFVFPPEEYYRSQAAPAAGQAAATATATAAAGAAGIVTEAAGPGTISSSMSDAEEGKESGKSSAGGAVAGASSTSTAAVSTAAVGVAESSSSTAAVAEALTEAPGEGKDSAAAAPPAAAAVASSCGAGGGTASRVDRRGRDAGACYRDALFLGDCDEGVKQLVKLLGWEVEFQTLLEEVKASFESGAQQLSAGGG